LINDERFPVIEKEKQIIEKIWQDFFQKLLGVGKNYFFFALGGGGKCLFLLLLKRVI